MEKNNSIDIDYWQFTNRYMYHKAQKYNLLEENREFEGSGFNYDNDLQNNRCYIKYKSLSQCESAKKSIAKLFTEKLFNQTRDKILDTKLTDELIEYIENHSYLSYGSDTIEKIKTKIKLRTLTQQEYDKINEQIEKYGSILPTSSHRKYSFEGGNGDVILSETFNKMYSIEDPEERRELHKDFWWKWYYTSMSWLSWAWYIHSWKKSLVFLPAVRFPIEDESMRPTVNWVRICAISKRWVVEREYPIIIFPQDKSVVDYAFIDPQDTQKVIETIKSKWEVIRDMPIHEYILDGFYDRNGEPVEIAIKYASENIIDNNKLKYILHYTGKLNEYRNFYNETGSEFDRVLGIYKVCNQYVGKWKYGLITRWFWSEHPRAVHSKDKKFMINGWTLEERWNLAYRKGNGVLYTKPLEEYNPAYINSIRVNGWYLMSSNNEIINSTEYGEIRSAIWDTDIVIYAGDVSYASCIDDLENLCKGMEVWSAEYLEKKYIESLPYLIEWIVSDLNRNQLLQEKFFSSDQSFENWSKSWNLIYRIVNNRVYICYITKNEQLHPKFDALNNPLQEYEMIVPLNEREEKWLEYYKSRMKHSAFIKSKNEYRNIQKWSTEKQVQLVKQYLGSNLQTTYTLQDSLDVGNCEPSSISFMSKYDIPTTGILSRELLDHKQLDQMLQDSRFRSIFLDKIDIDKI